MEKTLKTATGTAPDWSSLHWEEMQRVFNGGGEPLHVTDDGAPPARAGMWPLVNWDEVKRVLDGDEASLEGIGEGRKHP